MSRYFKTSLPPLMLLVALIALAIVHFRTVNTLNDSLRELRTKNYALEKRNETDRKEFLERAGYLSIKDPDRGYVRRLGASDGMVWQYRVYLPTDREYALYAGQAGGRLIMSRLPSGGDSDGFVLTLVFRRTADELRYVIVGPGFEGGGVVEGQGPWQNERYEPSEQSAINRHRRLCSFQQRL